MAKWKNIERLRDNLRSLRETKNRKFDMSKWIAPANSKDYYKRKSAWAKPEGRTTVADVRVNGASCSTAACLAGWDVIFNAPKSRIVDEYFVAEWAEKHLGLTFNEAHFMFGGDWTGAGRPISSITKAEAVKYLTKVLKEKNVMVSL